MLTTMRPHNSPDEHQWIEKYIEPEMMKHSGYRDEFGNIFIEIPTRDGHLSRVLWSSHTDTVHRDGGKQTVQYDPFTGICYKSDDNPLGADDAAGVWVMLEMIRASVPGMYVFHRGEERGGLGSAFIADNTETDWCKDIVLAVALDRRGTTSVITHQTGSRGMHHDSAMAIQGALEGVMPGNGWELDDTGVFTDTANYFELIPNCCNLSIGYEYEHTQHEMLDLSWLVRMRDAMVSVDWEHLAGSMSTSMLVASWDTYDTYDTHGAYDTYGVHEYRLVFDDIQDAYDYINEDPWTAAQMLFDAYRS